ncbi:hypothetical protein AN958_02787 [Leucoagaricus sp. SymC.cos]|nr:hypothetical protein AN958_02787 [Leucoagaricus sp. SymC.cos]
MVQRSPTYVMSTDPGWRFLLDGTYREGGPPTDVLDRMRSAFPRAISLEYLQRQTQELAKLDAYICSYGVFQDYYTRIYMTAHSASAIYWIGSVTPFIMLMTGIPIGRLYDRGHWFTFFGLGLFFPIFFLQLATTTHGLGKEFAFYSVLILNACACLGSILCSMITRIIGVDILAAFSAVGCACICFAFSAIGSATSVALVGVIYGLSFGTLISVLPALVGLLTDDPSELGLRLGIAYAFAGPPIMGALLNGYHWWKTSVFSAMVLLASAACFITVLISIRHHKKVEG